MPYRKVVVIARYEKDFDRRDLAEHLDAACDRAAHLPEGLMVTAIRCDDGSLRGLVLNVVRVEQIVADDEDDLVERVSLHAFKQGRQRPHVHLLCDGRVVVLVHRLCAPRQFSEVDVGDVYLQHIARVVALPSDCLGDAGELLRLVLQALDLLADCDDLGSFLQRSLDLIQRVLRCLLVAIDVAHLPLVDYEALNFPDAEIDFTELQQFVECVNARLGQRQVPCVSGNLAGKIGDRRLGRGDVDICRQCELPERGEVSLPRCLWVLATAAVEIPRDNHLGVLCCYCLKIGNQKIALGAFACSHLPP